MLRYFQSKETIYRMFPGQVIGMGERKHVYVDNGSPILLVAHVDTVKAPRLNKGSMTGRGFDDRLGVCLAHKLVKEYPAIFDLLLTDFEESGGSTAEYFNPSHKYNLVVELDREGADYVDYGLASDELHDLLAGYEFERGLGSYTDICSMPQVTCCKINVGIGTYDSHGKKSGYDKAIADLQIARLLGFVHDHHDTRFTGNSDEDWGYGPITPYGDSDYIEIDGCEYYEDWYPGLEECRICGAYVATERLYDYECPECCGAYVQNAETD